VASLAQDNKKGASGQRASAQFFGLEYRLDHLIATYSKPYVSFMDGITMGGGVGLSVHAPFRIATERTLFAMPETKIGFFPDVGGGFFLPRLDGEIGTYLALTGETLKGVHTLYAGIATHYLHSSSLEDLEQRLAELVFPDNESLAYKNTIVNSTIEEFVTGLPPNEPFVLSGSLREAIDRCFRFNTVEDILTALSNETVHKEWAEKTIEDIKARSPTSVRVALRQLRLGRDWSIAETFQREFLIASRFMSHPDFVEGVSAALAKKGERRDPVWNPPTLAETPETVVDEFFMASEGTKKLELLKPGAQDYLEYPHAMFGLPSEAYIQHVVQRGRRMTPKEFVNAVVAKYEGKAGVREKVWDVLNRKTQKDENGYVQWKPTTPATATTTTTTTEEA
jgi:3-hydroxyisobutyryl-CoA hydrolase